MYSQEVLLSIGEWPALTIMDKKKTMSRIKVILWIKIMKESVLWLALTEIVFHTQLGPLSHIAAKLKHLLKL